MIEFKIFFFQKYSFFFYTAPLDDLSLLLKNYYPETLRTANQLAWFSCWFANLLGQICFSPHWKDNNHCVCSKKEIVFFVFQAWFFSTNIFLSYETALSLAKKQFCLKQKCLMHIFFNCTTIDKIYTDGPFTFKTIGVVFLARFRRVRHVTDMICKDRIPIHDPLLFVSIFVSFWLVIH